MYLIYWALLVEIFHSVLTPARPQNNCIEKKYHLFCKNQILDTNGTYLDISVVEITDVHFEELDLNVIVEKFPNLQKLAIIGNNISYIKAPYNKTDIKVLQLIGLKLLNIETNFLDNFPKIEELNLTGNYLTKLNSSLALGTIKILDLSDNRWNCSERLDWVLNLNKSFVKNLDELKCYGDPHGGKPLVAIAEFQKDIQENCTEKCECTLPKVVRALESMALEPIIEVNCSDRGFTELPNKFPYKTKILHLEGNDIESLKPLRENPIYRNILDLYLDNNRVNSIEELEGSRWLRHFRVFSLSGNKLSELPSYAMDNALQQNVNMPNAVQISLGGNPWRCDCVFTPVFQEMLQKYAPQVKDVNEVKCSYVEGDENSLLPILELTRSSVCRFPTEYSVQEALDLLNAVLASLIVFVLGKLAYDYYHFKKTGRLPWIVTKMP